VTETLGAAADGNCAVKVKTGDKDFSAGIQLIKGESPDAVYYAATTPRRRRSCSSCATQAVTAQFAAR